MTSRMKPLARLVAGIIAAIPITEIPRAKAQSGSSLPMDRVYQGPIRYPDFNGRDRNYANYRTRIRNEMSTGPNFAGHFAVVEIGCGTSCRFAFISNVATGQVYSFPYGGEEYYHLVLTYNVKQNFIVATWIQSDQCIQASLTWNGTAFGSPYRRVLGPRAFCEQ